MTDNRVISLSINRNGIIKPIRDLLINATRWRIPRDPKYWEKCLMKRKKYHRKDKLVMRNDGKIPFFLSEYRICPRQMDQKINNIWVGSSCFCTFWNMTFHLNRFYVLHHLRMRKLLNRVNLSKIQLIIDRGALWKNILHVTNSIGVS